MPDDKAKYIEMLRTEAARLGSEYVVVITDVEELEKEMGVLPLEAVVYGALALKRATAHIGTIRDREAMEMEHKLKILDFTLGSRAKESGLKIGDIIKQIDGTEPEGSMYWKKALRWRVGEKVKVEVERDGKPFEVLVELTAD